MTHRTRVLLLFLVLGPGAGVAGLLAGPAGTARAACGADMCVLDLRGPESGAGRYSFEMAYQYNDMDEPRIGTRSAFVGEIPSHHNEIRTESRIWTMTGRALVTERIFLAATLPWMQRFHAHESEHHPGFYELQSWEYEGLGDLLVSGYVTPGGVLSPGPYDISLQLGVKAPTGRDDVMEFEHHKPEPMARPGSGSWDGLAGFQVRRPVVTSGFGGEARAVPFSIGVVGRLNGTGTEDYRIGNELQVNVAGGWALAPALTLLGQVNTRFRAKDREEGAIQENTGGTAVYATPGLRVGRGPIGAHAYWQFRLHENVNGIQVTAPSHLMVGMSYSP